MAIKWPLGELLVGQFPISMIDSTLLTLFLEGTQAVQLCRIERSPGFSKDLSIRSSGFFGARLFQNWQLFWSPDETIGEHSEKKRLLIDLSVN